MESPGPAAGGRHPLTSTPVGPPLVDRSISCDPDFQLHGLPTSSIKPTQQSNSFVQNHLLAGQNNHLQWKSAEDIFLSSTGGNILYQSMEADDGGGVREVLNNPSRLVSSVSAYPLPNTNTNIVSASIVNATPAAATTASAASTSTISSTSSSSTSTTSSSQNNIQPQQLSSVMVNLGGNSNTSYTSIECTTSGYLHHGSDAPSATSPITASTGDLNTSQCNSVGGIAPLDLSGIPPITQVTLPTPTENGEGRFSKSPTPSPKPSPTLLIRQTSCDSSDDRANKNDTCGFVSREGSMERSFTEPTPEHQPIDKLLDSISRSSESSRSVEAPRTPEIGSTINGVLIKDRKESRDSKSSDKKNNKAWYKMLNPTYKSRSEDLKRLFKDLPTDERLIVDYSCALQKDILVHGRLYVTPNYFCFYSKIFGWETFVSIKSKDIVAMTKEKTALVIPNAVEIRTEGEKHFFTSFASRDKTYLMLFRIWQNALMDQQMSATELWQWVHSSYGDELGLTSDDDDYVAPSTEDDAKTNTSHANSDRTCESSIFNRNLKLYSVDSLEANSLSELYIHDLEVEPLVRRKLGILEVVSLDILPLVTVVHPLPILWVVVERIQKHIM